MSETTQVHSHRGKPFGPTGAYDRFIAFRLVTMRAIALCWHDKQAEKEFVESPRDAFKKYFDYDFPLRVDLKMEANSGIWDLNTVNDWRCLKLNKLTMKIPPKPPVELQAQVLAAINAKQATFLD